MLLHGKVILKGFLVLHWEMTQITMRKPLFEFLRTLFYNRLLDFANGRKPRQNLLLESLKDKSAYLRDTNQISKRSDTVFDVSSSKGNDYSYTVDIENNSCSCPTAYSGVICKHPRTLD